MEIVAPDFVDLVGMRFDQNRLAALAGSTFNTSASIGKRIATTAFVIESDGHEESGLIALRVIYIPDLSKQRLIPLMAIFVIILCALITLAVEIFDSVAERILRER